MFKLLRNSPFLFPRILSYQFTTFQNVDFHSMYPVIKDLKNSETFEFKLLLENKEGKRVIFDLSKTHTIQDLFNKITENLQFKSLKAYSLDRAEISNMTTLSDLDRSNFYILADSQHFFKIIDAANSSSKNASSEVETYCDELHISHLQKKIISNYLGRLDILNEMKFGFKIFDPENIAKNSKTVDKEELLLNLVEALPTNRTNLVSDESLLQAQYFKLRADVENLQGQKKQLENYAKKNAKRKMLFGLGALFGQFGFVAYGTYVFWSWDIVEPMVYFIGLGASIVLGLQYFKINQQYSNVSFFEYLKERDLLKICLKVGFDLKNLEAKEKELVTLEKVIKSNFLMNL